MNLISKNCDSDLDIVFLGEDFSTLKLRQSFTLRMVLNMGPGVINVCICMP